MASGFSSKYLGKEIDNEISYVKEELRDIIKRHENNIEDISNELNDVSTKIPTKVSELENDKGYMLSTDYDGRLNGIDDQISEMNSELADVESIAKGRATGYVFDTLEDLDAWLSDETNTANLVLGDNFYIRAVDVPDYWWDGSAKQQLETQKVDLTEYVKNTDYATGTTYGVVKVMNTSNVSRGIVKNATDGVIQIACAGRVEMTNKLSYNRPITPVYQDYAVSVSTHQDMSDDYDVSSLKVAANFEGSQSQLPASYEAVKGYVDKTNVDSANKVDKVEGYGLISLYDNIIEDTLYGTDLTVIGEDGNKTYAFIPRLLSDMVDDVGYATNEKVDDTNEKINEIYDILTYTAPALTEVSPDGTMIGSDGWTGTGFMCTAENTKYAIKSSDMSNRIVGFNRFCLRFADASGNKWKNWSPWLDIDGVAYEFFYSPARKLYEALIPATTKTAEEIVSSIRWERAEPDVIRYGKISNMFSINSVVSDETETVYYNMYTDEASLRDYSGKYTDDDSNVAMAFFGGAITLPADNIPNNIIHKLFLALDTNCDGSFKVQDVTAIERKVKDASAFDIETIDNFA